MVLEKCSRCFRFKEESSKQFSIRTRNSFNTPFLCHCCTRILSAIEKNNPPIDLVERKKQRQRKVIEDFHKKLEEKYVPVDEDKKRILREKQRAYFQTEKGKEVYRRGWKKRLELLRKSKVELSKEEKKLIREFYKNRPSGYTVDHIIPLIKGGKHCLNNLQYLPPYANSQKSRSIDVDILKFHLKCKEITSDLLQEHFLLSAEDALSIMQEIESQ